MPQKAQGPRLQMPTALPGLGWRIPGTTVLQNSKSHGALGCSWWPEAGCLGSKGAPDLTLPNRAFQSSKDSSNTLWGYFPV